MVSRRKRNTTKSAKQKTARKGRTAQPTVAMAALRVFLGIVFVCAATYRMFHHDVAAQEMMTLALPKILIVPLILLEMGIGAALIAGWRTRQAAILTAFFLIFAVTAGVIATGPSIITAAGELFIFNPTPTDIFLHGTYLVIALTIALQYRRR